MADIDGLGLYNAGTVAGASQPHKHLQLLPLPLAGSDPPIPIERAFDHLGSDGEIARSNILPFRHAFARLDTSRLHGPSAAAEETLRLYSKMLDAVGIDGVSGTEVRPSEAYNLLIIRRWLLLVPRSTECFERISISALNFAGSLFVRDENQLMSLNGTERSPC